MRVFPNKFPSNIPCILASFVSAIFLAYFMTGLLLEMKIGRPSSTSAIGFFFIPIYALILFLVSFVVGEIVKFIAGKFIKERVVPKATRRITIAVFLMTIVASSIAGGISFKSHEDSQRPHVIFNSAVEKTPNLNYQEANQIESKLILTIFDNEKSRLENIIWNDKPVRFELIKNNNMLKLHDDKGKELALIDLKGFDYITRGNAIPIALPETNLKGLAVLVHLRSTSNRSMLLIYNSKADLIYQELLYRCRLDNIMRVVKDESGNEYLWLNVDAPVLYSFNRIKS